jgi:hypothetical protein
MKKLIIILIIIAISFSCGSGSVDISKLDSPCACAEAAVKLMKKILPYKDQMINLDQEEGMAFMKENGLEDFNTQMNDLQKKCTGDLNPRKAESECSAISEWKDLGKQF